jgi:Uma2 family endonuclease
MSIITSTPFTPGPPPGLLSAPEFCRRYEHRRAELVKGVVKEIPMPFLRHGQVCMRIAAKLYQYAEERDVGHVMSNDSFVQTGSNPDTVRGADVCFFSYERLPKGPVPEGLLSVVPDLTVEVRSPSDLWTEIFTKVGEYLRAGVRVVIVLDPATTTASVYRATELQQIFHAGDELTVPDVLPDLALRVATLFE